MHFQWGSMAPPWGKNWFKEQEDKRISDIRMVRRPPKGHSIYIDVQCVTLIFQGKHLAKICPKLCILLIFWRND